MMCGFHGCTLGSFSVIFKYCDVFELLLLGCIFVLFNNIDKLDSVIGEDMVVVMLEMV